MFQLCTISHFHCDEGLNITEVAHDYQSTIKKYVEELGMVNSYDTWHGMVSFFFSVYYYFDLLQARRMWQRSCVRSVVAWLVPEMLRGSLNFLTRVCSLWKLLLSMKQFAIQHEAPKCTCIGA